MGALDGGDRLRLSMKRSDETCVNNEKQQI